MQHTIETLRIRIAGHLTYLPVLEGLEYEVREPVLPISCADGLVLSVQAGLLNYSTPKENHAPFTKVEVKANLDEAPVLRPWMENGCLDGAAIFAYVPIEIVVDLINEHGGEVEGPAFPAFPEGVAA